MSTFDRAALPGSIFLCSLILFSALMLAALIAPGCSGAYDFAAAKGASQALANSVQAARASVSEMEGKLEAAEANASALPEGPKKVAVVANISKAQRVVASVREAVEQATPAIVAVNEQIQAAETPVEAALAGVTAAIGVVEAAPPTPLTPWLVMGGSLLTALLGSFAAVQQGRAKSAAVAELSATTAAAESIVKSVQPLVDAAIKADPSVQTTLRAAQTATARALVDTAQGKEE